MFEHVEPIRVLLVDDNEHVLWGLNRLIDGEWPTMTVAGSARTLAEAVAAIEACNPDVVVLDLFLGDDNSLDRLPELLEREQTQIVILTGVHDPEIVRRAIEAGVHTVVTKDQPADVLLLEIERAHYRGRAMFGGL